MSRIAKKPITIPAKTEVTFVNGVLTVKGPLGELKKNFRDDRWRRDNALSFGLWVLRK